MLKTRQFITAADNRKYWGILYIPDNISGKVPLVIFNHGAGETGRTEADTVKLYNNGPLNFIKSGWKPDFMILAMQDGSWSPTASAQDYVLKNDPDILMGWNGKDCLVTGLSAGGETTVLFMDTYNNPSFVYVPMSPAGDATLKNPTWPHKTWFFSGDVDYHFTDTAKALAAATKGRLTIFKGGHCCWNTFYNPNYREDGKNIYEYAFSAASVPVNKLPVAMAGPDQTIELPTSEVLLSGNGTDEDGTITNAKWIESKRPDGTLPTEILSPEGFTTQVRGLLKEGQYVYALTVFDNNSASATDFVTVNVTKPQVVEKKLTITGKDGVIFETNIIGDINISV